MDEAAVVLGLRLNEWTAMIVFLVGLVGFVAAGRRGADDAIARRGPEPDAVGSDDEDQDATLEGPHGDTDGGSGDDDRARDGNE